MEKNLSTTDIEKLALAGWAAAERVPFGEWELRAHHGGVTRRANSVCTLGAMPAEAPEVWMAAVERFYAERGQLPCYYLSDHSPAGLDELLAARGYRVAYPCFLMTADRVNVAAATSITDSTTASITLSTTTTPIDSITCELRPEADSIWIDEFLELEQFPLSRKPAYEQLFADMNPGKTFVRASIDGHTAALGTAVAAEGWAVVYNVVTAEQYRRRGAARAIMRAIAGWAEAQACHSVLLQVVRENEPAVTLYERLGFRPMCRQHYRLHPDD